MLKKDGKKNEILSETNNLEKLKQAKENNKKKKIELKINKRKLYLFTIILIVLIICIAYSLNLYFKNAKYKEYVKYEDKMHAFGFDRMYNNKSAKTNETVTKSEAIKLAVAAAFNTYDISGIAKANNDYQDSLWTEYAENMGIVKEDINSKNYNNPVMYKDVISYFENSKLKFLPDREVKNDALNLKDMAKYSVDQQAAIKDMVANKIIYLISKKLKGNDYAFKGQVNEIVVNFVENYNTITMLGDKINVNPEKIPSNAALYPYTLATVNKEVYEQPLVSGFGTQSITPKDLYANKKESYPQVKKYAEELFNNILNVDYRTITEEGLRQKLARYFIFEPTPSAIKVYTKYVKDNEIIIKGSAQVQTPVFYFDGISYRLRLELKFNVEHSKTKQNLLYFDFFDGLKKTYEKTNYDIFVDVPMSNAIGVNNIYIDETELYNSILNPDKSGITKEVETETYFREDEKE